MTKVKKSKKTYPIANKNLDIPEKTLLLGVLKEYKAYVDKLLAEIDDLKNKNKILIEKGKSLEKEKRELIESVALTKTEKKEVLRNVRKEENFGKGYIAGKYGAIPMLNLDFAHVVSQM